MTNGTTDLPIDRILKRSYILSNLEKIIEESVYYRTHSENFGKEKIIIGSIDNKEIITQIL